jgi:hypothetical protein
LSSARAESLTTDDEQALRSAGLSADGASLLAAVRKHTLTTETRENVDGLIARLGVDSFAEREKASKQLFALGRVTLLQLREASKHHDPEIARRAKSLIERIEQEPAHHLPAVALRLLAVRKPPGAVEALLDYLPYADDEDLAEEVQQSLAALARRDGKPEPALRRVLDDPRKAPAIRMRVALALAMAGEREAVPVLIELLAVLPAEQANQVEETLFQLAGDTAPEMPKGAETNDKKEHRDAWAAWWKNNAGRVDPSRLRANSGLGYTLICDNGNDRVFEIDRHGKQIWSVGGLENPIDAAVLPGNRVLIAEYRGDRVTERDHNSKILWQMKVSQPQSVQRLPNGHTLIASNDNGKPTAKVVEVDRAGKEISSIHLPTSILAAYRWPQGDTACKTYDGQCRIFGPAGKQLKAFAVGRNKNVSGGLDLRSNGHILITRQETAEVVEFDREGRLLLQLKTPNAIMASLLPNGHILVACCRGAPSNRNASRVYEMDRGGKIVWEYKGTGNFIRARRR